MLAMAMGIVALFPVVSQQGGERKTHRERRAAFEWSGHSSWLVANAAIGSRIIRQTAKIHQIGCERDGGACDEGGAAVALEEVVGVNVRRRSPFLGAMGRAALRDGGGGCVIVVVIIVSSSLFRSGDWGARFSIRSSVVHEVR